MRSMAVALLVFKESSDAITLQADGDVTTGRGGDVGIEANGDVTVNRKVRGRAESAHVVVDAGGTVRVLGRVTVTDSGTIDVSAGTSVQLAPGSLLDATGSPAATSASRAPTSTSRVGCARRANRSRASTAAPGRYG